MNAPTDTSLECFLLTAQSRDNGPRFEITLWAADASGKAVRIKVDDFRPLFFCPRTLPEKEMLGVNERKKLPLRSLDMQETDCLYFNTFSQMQHAARDLRTAGLKTFESDIHPMERYLMERMVSGGMKVTGTPQSFGSYIKFTNPHLRGCLTAAAQFKTVSIDIETNVSTGEIYSIACADALAERVFMRGALQNADNIKFCKDERQLLTEFFAYIQNRDPDIIIGWSVIDFDLRVIQERCAKTGVPFEPGRERGSRIVKGQTGASWNARIPGRVVLDVPTMLRAYHHTFEEYSLDFVASQILGQRKTIELTGKEKISQIDNLFNTNKLELARYNLTDAKLTLGIFTKTGILQNAVERSKRSGSTLDRTGASVAAFDHLYLPRLHRAGFVAGDTFDIIQTGAGLPGGHVLDPKPGLYENVLVFDFKSLYPSIIMTFMIDPLGFKAADSDRISNPAGTSFSKKQSILPEIIRELMEARAKAREQKNQCLSQAIKILMNSFYGVLGSTGCRFFSEKIASTITLTGRYILTGSIEHIEKTSGKRVIYGDTDSLFVHLGETSAHDAAGFGETIAKETSKWLCEHLKENFNAHSSLELQYEIHYRHFFLPSLRGGEHGQGSKKHYCGAAIDQNGKIHLTFKGMEAARSDWTELAKEFQHTLFSRFFSGQPLTEYIRATAELLQQGHFDRKLIYKKRLRKRIGEYTVHVPPHVQAAKLLDSPSRTIKYCITKEGPQPIEKLTAPLDYQHYLDSQLKPIADSILEWTGTSFDKIISGQQDLFQEL
ncbi:MAG: DNA polymerase II [Chitinispirillales bacterium]|jgi:DNA polymerase-2|nr:DNA polymerase II [Chitinispirillales bacterium]